MVEDFLAPFKHSGASPAAIAPHAGWYYSGKTAPLAVASLDPSAETVAVIGGHLPPGMPILLAAEDGVETPLGIMEIDKELRKEFENRVSSRPDNYNDNTVEVLLPIVRYFFPEARLLWMRFPAGLLSFDAGKLLEDAAKALKRRIVVLGSTDLTHYGDNYGFSPKGKGKAALEWVKKENDASLISAVLDNDPYLVLKRADEDYSACSVGAILGVMGFIASLAKNAKLLEYTTSVDVVENNGQIPSSFVGYAAISWV
jgi:AmmeMemoRadiSam system protein B